MANSVSTYAPPDKRRSLVLAWLRRAREWQQTHFEYANELARRDLMLGVPVILITAMVGTTIFASLSQENVSTAWKIAVGMLSVAAAVLSSLKTFLKYSEQSEKHRLAAARYGAVKRKLESVYVEESGAPDEKYLDVLRSELDRLAEESPAVPARIFARLAKGLGRETQPAAVRG